MKRVSMKHVSLARLVGEAFEIYGGGNHHGRGKQFAVVHTITKQGNIYCYKISKKGKLIAKKFKLNWDDVIRPIPNLEAEVSNE